MNPFEKEIESTLRKMVQRHGGRCLKWVCPGWAGVPDRIILLPGGRVIFAETKRPKGGVLDKRQQKWGEILKGLGFHHFVVWNYDDVALVEEVICQR